MPEGPVHTVEKPLFAVVRGEPTVEELAALVAVMSAGSAAGDVADVADVADVPSAPSRWVDRGGSLRRPIVAGPGAWKASALPR
ncbi:MAG: acyl-CoA carboxylase subunit epsilon [Mycobacteriales bacterium]